MTALNWSTVDTPNYEYGVERGVLYPSESPGVAWYGLISVAERTLGGEQSFLAKDGVTYLNTVSAKEYQATLRAFSAPREFAPCVGDLEVIPGFILTKQPKTSFGFSYRTQVADEYKIHLVYNATATPTGRSYATTNDTPTPTNLEWLIDTVPESVPGYRPSAHFTVSTLMSNFAAVSALEDILYGTDTDDPRLPSVDELITLISSTYPEYLFDDMTPSSSSTLVLEGGTP